MPSSPRPSALPARLSSTSNDHLNLARRRADQLRKLLTDTRQKSKTVVVGQSLKEVLDSLAGRANGLGELGNDGLLVAGRQLGSGQDTGELGILRDEVSEAGDGLGGGLEGGRLDGGSVLAK